MVHHIILWKLKDELDEQTKEQAKKEIKEGLESLYGVIPGLLSIKVITEGLPTSNMDLMLDSTFDSFESLKGYSVHPEHVAIASTKVATRTSQRNCIDFED